MYWTIEFVSCSMRVNKPRESKIKTKEAMKKKIRKENSNQLNRLSGKLTVEVLFSCFDLIRATELLLLVAIVQFRFYHPRISIKCSIIIILLSTSFGKKVIPTTPSRKLKLFALHNKILVLQKEEHQLDISTICALIVWE